MKQLLILLVRFYQIILSPMLRFSNGGYGCCRHEPSCSHYAIEAIQAHGALRGGWLTLCRLGKCHPWGTHGYDPVPSISQTTTNL